MSTKFAHVHSVRDIDYTIIPNSTFHSLFYDQGRQRILRQVPQQLVQIVNQVFSMESTPNVWAIVFESKQKPIYTIRNLAHSNVSPNFRRVLRVNLDIMTGISNQAHNNQTSEELNPLI
jgi:hypothetical protein